MVLCAVVGCSTRSDCRNPKEREVAKVGLFRLPKAINDQCDRTRELSERRRNLWLARINRADLHTKASVRVCGYHFITGKPSHLFNETNPDWAPSLALGYHVDEKSVSRNSARYLRTAKRNKQATSLTAAAASPRAPLLPDMDVVMECQGIPEETSADIPEETGTAVQTDMAMADINALERECVRLNDQVYQLREDKQQLEYSEDSLKNDQSRVSFYTGLANFAILLSVYNMMEKLVTYTSNNRLEKFQECLLFFMKLKLNLHFQDLGFRFKVSESTASRIFDKWLHVAYCRLRSQVVWPDRANLRATMPQAFYDTFGDSVSVILDCFEVRIERPSSLLPRSETWSQYKANNTAKYLIGIAPQGVITFISYGWGGRVSDKHITEQSGILDNLMPGDLVLADRGFDIADTLGFYCAKLNIPAFTKGKQQLSAVEVQSTRKLANVRIHVERVIGLIRNKYIILKSYLPISYVSCKPGDDLTPLDKIVTVCCGLSNLCCSVVLPCIENSSA